jgi:hypothetical protein
MKLLNSYLYLLIFCSENYSENSQISEKLRFLYSESIFQSIHPKYVRRNGKLIYLIVSMAGIVTVLGSRARLAPIGRRSRT